jgi:hypothetical protein
MPETQSNHKRHDHAGVSSKSAMMLQSHTFVFYIVASLYFLDLQTFLEGKLTVQKIDFGVDKE